MEFENMHSICLRPKNRMRDKLAHFIGPDWIDPYFRQAFDQLKKPENEHVNGWVTNNCKSEANKLRELAWQKWQSNR